MNEQELHRLYALSLALVPDADVAGDLFMDARDEADLQRRATRWLKGQGLPLPQQPVAVAPLNADQKEHALHLARRGRRRRQAKLSLVATVAAIAVALVLIARPSIVPASGLVADRSFKGQPQVMSVPMEGIVFAVHRTEATQGEVIVWWSFQGHDAARMEQEATPLLLVQNRGTLAPDLMETDVIRSDRLLGRTVYRVSTTQRDRVFVEVIRNGEWVPFWRLKVAVNQVSSTLSSHNP